MGWILNTLQNQPSNATLELCCASWTKMTASTRVTVWFVLDRVRTHSVTQCMSSNILHFFHLLMFLFLFLFHLLCFSSSYLLSISLHFGASCSVCFALCFFWTELPLLRGENYRFLLPLLQTSCCLSPCLFFVLLFLRYPFPFSFPQSKTIVCFMVP